MDTMNDEQKAALTEEERKFDYDLASFQVKLPSRYHISEIAEGTRSLRLLTALADARLEVASLKAELAETKERLNHALSLVHEASCER